MSSLKRKRDDSEDDDDVPSFGRQILPVANLPLTFDGEPSDGMEYLFTVRRDARLLPHITRVKNPYQSSEPVLPPPLNLEATHPSLPSAEWRSLLEIRFRNLRKNVELDPGTAVSNGNTLFPDKQDRSAWWDFLAGKPESVWNPPKKPKALKQKKYGRGMRAFNDDETNLDYNASASVLYQENEAQVAQPLADSSSAMTDPPLPQLYKHRTPTPSLLAHVDERMSLHLLMYFTYWINLHLSEEHQPPFPRLTQAHSQWIFALLTRVEDYISGDDMSLLRNLARACIALLKVMSSERVPGPAIEDESLNVAETEDKKDADASIDQASCWTIVSVVIGVWGQKDLWIDAEDMLKSIKYAP